MGEVAASHVTMMLQPKATTRLILQHRAPSTDPAPSADHAHLPAEGRRAQDPPTQI